MTPIFTLVCIRCRLVSNYEVFLKCALMVCKKQSTSSVSPQGLLWKIYFEGKDTTRANYICLFLDWSVCFIAYNLLEFQKYNKIFPFLKVRFFHRSELKTNNNMAKYRR